MAQFILLIYHHFSWFFILINLLVNFKLNFEYFLQIPKLVPHDPSILLNIIINYYYFSLTISFLEIFYLFISNPFLQLFSSLAL